MRLLAALLCLTPLLAHVHCEDVFGIVGENFTFPVKIDQRIVETGWKKNKDKVAEWEGQKKPKYFPTLEGRSVLQENGSLTILNLTKDDAGMYELHYWDSRTDHYLNFKLDVLDPLPEPKIGCNTSGGELVLNCTADFERPLNYTLKLSNYPEIYQRQELPIPLENVDPTTKAACVIAFSQRKQSSEISLIQCLPGEKAHSSQTRNRVVVIVVVVLFAVAIGLLVFILRKGRTAQRNTPVYGSGEHEQLFHGDSQEQPNSGAAASSQAAFGENEEPEADRELNKEDRALKGKQTVNSDGNQEEVAQDAEGGNGKHLSNSPSCSTEDLKS